MISGEYINYSRGGTKTHVNKEDTLLATELNNSLHFGFQVLEEKYSRSKKNSRTPGSMRTLLLQVQFYSWFTKNSTPGSRKTLLQVQ